MKNILLIESGARYTLYPPIGLMHLGAVLREKYNVKIKDYSGREIDESKIKEDIQKSEAFGVGLKKNGKIKITPASKHFIDLDKLPLPAWDLIEDINRYFPDKRQNVLPLSTTRGCAFKCGFCHNSNENVR